MKKLALFSFLFVTLTLPTYSVAINGNGPSSSSKSQSVNFETPRFSGATNVGGFSGDTTITGSSLNLPGSTTTYVNYEQGAKYDETKTIAEQISKAFIGGWIQATFGIPKEITSIPFILIANKIQQWQHLPLENRILLVRQQLEIIATLAQIAQDPEQKKTLAFALENLNKISLENTYELVKISRTSQGKTCDQAQLNFERAVDLHEMLQHLETEKQARILKEIKQYS